MLGMAEAQLVSLRRRVRLIQVHDQHSGFRFFCRRAHGPCIDFVYIAPVNDNRAAVNRLVRFPSLRERAAPSDRANPRTANGIRSSFDLRCAGQA